MGYKLLSDRVILYSNRSFSLESACPSHLLFYVSIFLDGCKNTYEPRRSSVSKN